MPLKAYVWITSDASEYISVAKTWIDCVEENKLTVDSQFDVLIIWSKLICSSAFVSSFLTPLHSWDDVFGLATQHCPLSRSCPFYDRCGCSSHYTLQCTWRLIFITGDCTMYSWHYWLCWNMQKSTVYRCRCSSHRALQSTQCLLIITTDYTIQKCILQAEKTSLTEKIFWV